ncbi:MAG TPA: methylmalonyl Co-A mutase-associated GTPase MeaB [Amaricoccus sp.]|uniref:ArgK/MeaB family GTPase n=1 Tax=Amaricoccus sp. TaxID=1872485 RepID=UPI002B6616DA|nr:methylmalonyl Co-A mutase-associated GTPase MeaB [Amaricoccus sp.]HRO11179.1 methylmalonyl Co-A mutase-associated GTPase MeaB [Amaricoccus sp.]
MKPLPRDLPALAAGGKAALARCLSALESASGDPGLTRLLDAAWQAPRGVALGLTGPPGVGKSTLANSLVRKLRQSGQTVGVVAVDPSSGVSGGALLGDRARMELDPDDPGVFVRSMAAGRHLGGLARPAFPAVVLMRACFDWVLVETVGVGQSETEIAECADLVLLCVQPGSGDALQFMKAGIMEVPDLVLVTKGDLGVPARRAARDLRGALSLAVGQEARVALVSAHTGEGLDGAVALVAAARDAIGDLAGRRRAQVRAWASAHLLESFGTIGFAALAPLRPDLEAPFAWLRCLENQVSGLVNEVLKTV